MAWWEDQLAKAPELKTWDAYYISKGSSGQPTLMSKNGKYVGEVYQDNKGNFQAKVPNSSVGAWEASMPGNLKQVYSDLQTGKYKSTQDTLSDIQSKIAATTQAVHGNKTMTAAQKNQFIKDYAESLVTEGQRYDYESLQSTYNQELARRNQGYYQDIADKAEGKQPISLEGVVDWLTSAEGRNTVGNTLNQWLNPTAWIQNVSDTAQKVISDNTKQYEMTTPTIYNGKQTDLGISSDVTQNYDKSATDYFATNPTEQNKFEMQPYETAPEDLTGQSNLKTFDQLNQGGSFQINSYSTRPFGGPAPETAMVQPDIVPLSDTSKFTKGGSIFRWS